MANSKDTLPDQKRTGGHQSREIYDLVRGFIGLLTPEGNLLDANQSALDFIGCDLDEVVGRPFWETFKAPRLARPRVLKRRFAARTTKSLLSTFR